jgi:oligopeptidase A
MTNPLLAMTGLPPFSRIKPEHVEPALDEVLKENRARIDALVHQTAVYTWNDFIEPLEEIHDRLSRLWSPVSHLNSVMNSDALRDVYNKCLPKLTEYYTELGQNERIYQAYKDIADGPEYKALDGAQRKVIDNALRDFRLSGVALPPEKKARYKDIVQELSQLKTKFEENVLDATHGWHRQVADETQLSGLPESARALARQHAEEKNLEGWVFTLDFPSYYAVMTHADDRALRRDMYEAYSTRASERGPNAGKWDNSAIADRILALRHEKARLLDFANYAEYSLATKMARDPFQVLDFLHDLAHKSKSFAQRDLEQVRAFARDQHGLATLETWDISYYSEKLREQRYAFSQEDLKPYFPVDRVIGGMFEVVRRLYGISIREAGPVDVWHKDVRFYEIRDAHGELRGQFYLDLYARQGKRGGAWMDDCIGRRKHAGGVQSPVAYLVCNFTPPVGTTPVLLTHQEVETLFHEFGHGLHHMLTRVDYLSVSGINGVAWDAVELPSQFMENWCWEREALDVIAGHYQTGAPLPQDLLKKMQAAKNFQSGMQMVRQLEFALFDFRLHLEYDPTRGARIRQILDEVRREVAVVIPPDYNRFQNSFTHIFAGGYAAGYYSYKWAEVLSADAFSLFEECGVFNADAGRKFLTSVLERGGSREPMELFVEFRGREPSVDALLRHNGITA